MFYWYLKLYQIGIYIGVIFHLKKCFKFASNSIFIDEILRQYKYLFDVLLVPEIVSNILPSLTKRTFTMENIPSGSADPQKVDKVDALDIANNNIGKYDCKSCDMTFFQHWTFKQHNSSIHNFSADDTPKPKSGTESKAFKKPLDEDDESSDDSDVDSDDSSDDDSDDFEDPDNVEI